MRPRDRRELAPGAPLQKQPHKTQTVALTGPFGQPKGQLRAYLCSSFKTCLRLKVRKSPVALEWRERLQGSSARVARSDAVRAAAEPCGSGGVLASPWDAEAKSH